MTLATLRPNGTYSSTSVSTTGAANAHTALNDNSDSSYVTGSTAGASVQVDVGTVSLPVGSIVKHARIRMRSRTNVTTGSGGSTGLTCDFAIVDPSDPVNITLIATAYNNTVAAGTPWEDSASAYSTNSPAGGWTQGFVDAARIRVNPPPGGVGEVSDVSEVYADLVYVAKPVTVVTAVTPDPYTASNIIPVAWTNTLDADGGAQTRYRLKAFTAAQYGAGGFDPETSTPFYDSGETISAGTSASTSVLDNSTTYRVYVKVAQTVNGVSHWSAWAYDQIAVSVTTANISTVVGVANNTTASITVTVTRSGATAWEFMEVERSTDAGATWSPVRGATYVPASGTSFVVTDYETGNSQSTKYRARATRIVSTLPITGSWVESSAVSWTSASAWLKSPTNPTINAPTILAAAPQSSTTRERGVFNVIGAAFPVVISDVRRKTTGVLAFQTDNLTTSITALEALLDADVVLLQCPPAWAIPDMYVSLGDVNRERGPHEVFPVTVWTAEYVDTAAPPDPAASAP